MPKKKEWIEIILMPVVLALVGIAGTYLITSQQEKNTKERVVADQEIKLLEIFAQKITSSNVNQRLLALRFLKAVNGDLAAKLASAVSDTEQSQSPVREVATQIAAEATARARSLPIIYIHIRKEADRSAARLVGDKLKEEGFVVPGTQLVINGPSTSELRYFRKENMPEAESIKKYLSQNNVVVTPKYMAGYEQSQEIGPLHYELWFPPGEPGQ